jgi:hypothetical protein
VQSTGIVPLDDKLTTLSANDFGLRLRPGEVPFGAVVFETIGRCGRHTFQMPHDRDDR